MIGTSAAVVGADPWQLTAATTALRLGAAALFGAVIGFEREVDGHDAGLRTHVLLALGAALFGALSVGAFGAFAAPRNSTDVSIDPTRIASYVSAGVGFLGGGVIIKRGDRIRGLTTAASLWVVAAVGLSAGLGFWSGSLIASGIAIVVLVADWPLRRLTARVRRARITRDLHEDDEPVDGGV
jgi:putative Mg2+ transporter-C (MgtC) family protein